MGISFFVYYIFHFLGIKLIVYKRYGIYLNKEIYLLFFKCCLLCGSVFLINYLPWPFYKYLLMGIITLFTCFYMIFLLNKKIPLKELLTLFSKNRLGD